MYFPGIVTILYLYLSVKKSDNLSLYSIPSVQQLIIVLLNVIITDILVTYVFWYVNLFSSFSFINILSFFLVQDIYFYTVHKILHKYAYRFHKTHHEIFGPFYAWHASILDHILLNLMSVALPFYLFPNTKFVLFLGIIIQMNTSINGHTLKASHHLHHINPTKRLGSIYILDRLFGSY